MTSSRAIKAVAVLALIGMFAWGPAAFAGEMGKKKPFGGDQRMGGRGFMDELSDEQKEQLKEQKKAFRKDTEDLKQEIYENKMELLSVLAKKEPDAKKAKKIQEKISKLNAELDMKKIDHIIELKKISPKVGRFLMDKILQCQGCGNNKGFNGQMGGGKDAHGCPGRFKGM